MQSNVIDDDETNFPHKLLLTNQRAANLRKGFAGKSSNDIKLSKTRISKVMQSGGFLGKLLGPLLKTGLPQIKSVIKPSAASAADAGIHKKISGSGRHHSSSSSLHHRPFSSAFHNNTIIIILNDQMKDITKIVKSLEDLVCYQELVDQFKMKLKNKVEDFLVCC